MNFALILALFSQWDFNPPEPILWDMQPVQAEIKLGPKTELLLQNSNPHLYVFAPYWSSKSSSALQEIEKLSADYNLHIEYDDSKFPQHIKNFASSIEGGGYPVIWWKVSPTEGKVREWTSNSDFCIAYENTTAPAPVISQSVGGYPVHKQRWNISGNWNPSLPTVVNHLKTNQNHKGKVDPSWIDNIAKQPSGRAQLLSFHDDDHEGRVKWEYVRKPIPVKQVPKKTMVYRPACPNGRCPTYR
ncbi:MAG: hypothetical protein ACHQ1D_00495 [Nitrososphaerales archaeon]